jgi:hypothetical protein
MSIIRKDTFTCYFPNEDAETPVGASKTQYPNKDAAMEAARTYVGNNSFVKPFPSDETYLFGPGDGTTSVIVSQDIEFGDDK